MLCFRGPHSDNSGKTQRHLRHSIALFLPGSYVCCARCASEGLTATTAGRDGGITTARLVHVSILLRFYVWYAYCASEGIKATTASRPNRCFCPGLRCAVHAAMQRAPRRQQREDTEASAPQQQPHGFGPIGMSNSDLAVQTPPHRRRRHQGRRCATSALPTPATSHVSTAHTVQDHLDSTAGGVVTAGDSAIVPAGSRTGSQTEAGGVVTAGDHNVLPAGSNIHQPADNGSRLPIDTVSQVPAGSDIQQPADDRRRLPTPTVSHVQASSGELPGNSRQATGLTSRLRGLSDSLTQYWTAR